MAYLGGDIYLAVWAAETLEEDRLSENSLLLLGMAEDAGEAANLSPEPSRGFIIRDWFGPFLLGPASRFLRGRC